MKTVIERIIIFGLIAICLIPLLSATPSGARQVEVRRATRATPAEIAAANQEENRILAEKNAKTAAKKSKALSKSYQSRIRDLEKYSTKTYRQNLALQKQIKGLKGDVAKVKGLLKHQAWKKRNFIAVCAVFVLGSGALGFALGLGIGAFFRRKDRFVNFVMQPAPVAPAPPAAPAPVAAPSPAAEPSPGSFVAWADSYTPAPTDSLVSTVTPTGNPVNENNPEVQPEATKEGA